MHPQRWGDPASRGRPPRLRPRPGRAGLRPRRDARRSTRSTLPPSALPDRAARLAPRVVGDEHVLTDDETRRLRTRGKSTPDLLRARAGDLDRRPRRRRPPGLARRGRRGARAGRCEHHVAVVPFGGGTCVTGGLAARRDGFAGLVSPRPGPDEAAGLASTRCR